MPAAAAAANSELTKTLGDLDQVARMTVVLGRDQAEVKHAANACCVTLRAANSFMAGGRADMGTKAAVRFAFELGQKLIACLRADSAGAASGVAPSRPAVYPWVYPSSPKSAEERKTG